MTTDAEAAVRRYLAWLDDPSTAVDPALVAAAQAAFESAADPIAKLHAAADLERARAGDEASIEAGFVSLAKVYAAEQDIPAAAFAALGVPAAVLARAGLGPAGGGRGRGASRGRSSGAPRSRAPQVSVTQIKAVVGQMPKRFTLAQLADRAGGGSPATIRKAVEELVVEGRVTSLGPVPDHSGPGRAPTQYEQR